MSLETQRPSLLLTTCLGTAAGVGISCAIWIAQEHKLMNTLFSFVLGGATIGAIASASGYKISELQIVRDKMKDWIGIEEDDVLDYSSPMPGDEHFSFQPQTSQVTQDSQEPEQPEHPEQPEQSQPSIPTTSTRIPDPWEEEEGLEEKKELVDFQPKVIPLRTPPKVSINSDLFD